MTLGVLGGAVVVGLGASVVGYDLATSGTPDPTTASESVSTKEVTPARRNREKPRFAPCPPRAVLEQGECVVDEVRTVVVPAPAPLPAAPAPAAAAVVRLDDDSHHGGDDEDAHHGGDDSDDDSHHGGDDDRDDD